MLDFAQAVFELTGVTINTKQLQAFDVYARELAEWNQHFNLTTISGLEHVRIKHFLDSLSCWLALREAPPKSLIDVGSGAGFPGLPLKILRPEIQLTLIESTGKKASFLEHMVQVLGLAQVTVLNKRAEEVGQMPEHREANDSAIARAVAPLPELVEYLLPLTKIGGHILTQKGKAVKAELEAAKGAIEKLGGGESKLMRANVPGLEEERWLIVIEKAAATPAKYPRRAGIPAKRPLK